MKSRMKLLFTYFLPSGGIETLNRIRCRALRQAGIECHLLYLWDGAGRQNLTDIPHFITNDNGSIRSILELYRYNAVIASCDHLMLQRLRGLGYTGTLIYEVQGFGNRETARGIIAEASLYVRKYAQGAISPPTSHLMELFQTYLSDFPRFYVQNMVDTQRFTYREASSLNPSGRPIAAWVGRLEHNKNWALFLQICALLTHHIPDLQVWMFVDANITEPGQQAAFDDMTRTLGLLPRLTVRSNVPHDQMALYLSAVGDSGGMLVSTSHVEGFGYAVAEAMSCRCPVLSTDSDGVRSLIEHNRTGKFFAAADNAVAEALDYMNNLPLTGQIRQQAQDHIRIHFSGERYTADMNNILIALGVRPPS
jgi:glycosyltransferase involved in cell wall biosynthesis